ncbi:MAG: outer membrane beta-barrel protein [Paludibacteraceae bacterium]|nr:outer membrane beta-barrel protein [Paludibacteraceae bacterium]
MKKHVLLVAGCLLVSATTFAENRFGVTAGANINYNSSYETFKTSPGFEAGLAWEHSFGSTEKGHPFFNVGLLYSLRNSKYEESVPGGRIPGTSVNYPSTTRTYSYHDSYLVLPISAGYNFQLSEKFGLAPKTGISANKNIKEKEFGFGAELGVNLNIGKKFQVGLSHEWTIANHYEFGGWETKDLCNLVHANLTYYIF